MADIGITKYRARVVKENALPSNPGNPATNPVDPVNPPASGGGTGVNQFIQLTDTPASYSGATLNYARVNAGGTGLEFRTPAQVKSDLGVVESINAGAGIQVNPNPTASTPQVALTGQALSFHSLTGDGFVYRTSGTVGVRTLTAGTGITITNGDGIAGNPVIKANNIVKSEYNSALTTLSSSMQDISTGINIAVGDIEENDYIEYHAIIDLRLTSIVANTTIQIRPKTSIGTSGLGAANLDIPISGNYNKIEMKAFFRVTSVGQLQGMAIFSFTRQDSNFLGTFTNSTSFSTIQTSGGMDSVNFDFKIEAQKSQFTGIDTQVYFETVKIYKKIN